MTRIPSAARLECVSTKITRSARLEAASEPESLPASSETLYADAIGVSIVGLPNDIGAPGHRQGGESLADL